MVGANGVKSDARKSAGGGGGGLDGGGDFKNFSSVHFKQAFDSNTHLLERPFLFVLTTFPTPTMVELLRAMRCFLVVGSLLGCFELVAVLFPAKNRERQTLVREIE